MKKRNYKISKRILLTTVFTSFLLMGIYMTTLFMTIDNDSKTIYEKPLSVYEKLELIRQKLLIKVRATDGEGGSVGTGTDEVVNIYFYPHSATSTYNSGLSEGSAYEHFDSSFTNGEELEGETPHSTLFDIIIEMQYDKDHVYDTGWNTDLVDCYCNASSDSITISSQIMEHSSAFFETDADDGRINFYLQDEDGGAGSGFTFTQLEQLDDIEFKPYYYT